MSQIDLVSRMRAGFAITDPDTRVSYHNVAGAEILGWESPESLIGMHSQEFFDPENICIHEAVRDQARAGVGGSYALELLGRGGRKISVLANTSPMFDPDGSFLGVIFIFKPGGSPKHITEEAVEFHQAAARTARAVVVSSIRRRSAGSGAVSEGEPSDLEPTDKLDLNALSPRETEIVHRLAKGEPPATIATCCHISRHTVRNHFKSIFRKLGVHSQLELLTKLRDSS